jgi:hypothetical protein
MSWKIAAAGSLLTALWLLFTSSTSNQAAARLAAMMNSGMLHPEEMNENLHSLMARESMRQPYGSATPQYVSWVVQQIRVKNQGKKIVAVILCGVAWYLFSHA